MIQHLSSSQFIIIPCIRKVLEFLHSKTLYSLGVILGLRHCVICTFNLTIYQTSETHVPHRKFFTDIRSAVELNDAMYTYILVPCVSDTCLIHKNCRHCSWFRCTESRMTTFLKLLSFGQTTRCTIQVKVVRSQLHSVIGTRWMGKKEILSRCVLLKCHVGMLILCFIFTIHQRLCPLLVAIRLGMF